MSLEKKKVLVLNNSYEPINICSWKKAIIMLIKGVATSLENTADIIRSPSVAVPLPSVLRLAHYVPVPKLRKKLNKSYVLIRDSFICQYCGKKLRESEITFDHIIPRSRGGRNNWQNLATACPECNAKKADKLPEEAGFILKRDPRRYHPFSLLYQLQCCGYFDEKWKKYLFLE